MEKIQRLKELSKEFGDEILKHGLYGNKVIAKILEERGNIIDSLNSDEYDEFITLRYEGDTVL